MAMPIEAFMPCIGTVDACVTSTEQNVPVGCCPTGIDSPRIITRGADFVSDFTITYNGTLFNLFTVSENWKVTVCLENLGGNPDVNVSSFALVPHVQSISQVITGQVVINNPGGGLVPGDIYKPVYKVELIVNGTLIVCAFTEGPIFHAGE